MSIIAHVVGSGTPAGADHSPPVERQDVVVRIGRDDSHSAGAGKHIMREVAVDVAVGQSER